MKIYIDSAKEAEVRAAKELGYVRGVTTNPSLLAQAGLPPAEAIRRLAAVNIGPIWVQMVSKTLPGLQAEAQAVRALVPGELVVKIAPTAEGYRFVAQANQQYTFCITAVFSPAQALVAAEVGARYVAVYVNRATRALGDGVSLLRQTAAVLAGTDTGIIAASIKTADEAAQSAIAGSELMTVSFETLQILIQHPVTDETLARFDENGVGIFASGTRS